MNEQERAAMQQALEALARYDGCLTHFHERVDHSHAITALKAALAERTPDYERGFVDGMSEQARRSVDKAVNAMAQWRGCQVCGIGADGKAYGYVCPRGDCPTRITCGGAV